MSKPDDLGQTDVEIHQTYRGIEVIGPCLKVHLTHDSVNSMRGRFKHGISVSTDPVLSSQEAVRIALHYVVTDGGIYGAVKGVRGPVVYVNYHDKVCLADSVRVGYLIDSNDRYKGGRFLDDVFVNALTGTVVGVHPLDHKGSLNTSSPPNCCNFPITLKTPD
ncbi:MAG: hypothetical protein WBC78_09950 [Candidatus Sulfotelmatobacter sp.]